MNARLENSIQTALRRAQTLLDEGYRFVPSPDVPRRLLVIKPFEQVPSYDLDFTELPNGQLTYTCSCAMYTGLKKSNYRNPLCKHGECMLIQFAKACAMIHHVLSPQLVADPQTNALLSSTRRSRVQTAIARFVPRLGENTLRVLLILGLLLLGQRIEDGMNRTPKTSAVPVVAMREKGVQP